MDLKIILVEAGIAIARLLWHKAHGDSTKPDEAAIRDVGRKAAEAAAARAALEIERAAAAAGMQTASVLLAKAAAELLYELGRVETDPSPDIPDILQGASITEMPAGSTVNAAGDWTVPEEVPLSPVLDSDDLPTKPGDA